MALLTSLLRLSAFWKSKVYWKKKSIWIIDTLSFEVKIEKLTQMYFCRVSSSAAIAENNNFAVDKKTR